MRYRFCGDINPYSLYISNARDCPPKCTKRYFYKFFKEITIQKNGYPLY